MTLLRGEEIVGRPVVTTCCGEDVAQIRSIVYAGTERRFVGFTLAKRGMFHGKLKESLPAEHVAAVGPDAVIIDACDHLVDRAAAPDALAAPSKADTVVGLQVLGEDGLRLGDIGDLIFRAGPGTEVVGFVLRSDEPAERFIPAWLDLQISADAVIVPRAAADELHRDLSGFGAAVDEHDRGRGGSGGAGS